MNYPSSNFSSAEYMVWKRIVEICCWNFIIFFGDVVGSDSASLSKRMIYSVKLMTVDGKTTINVEGKDGIVLLSGQLFYYC